MITPPMQYPKQYQQVDGRRIARVEAGEGDPIVFLHGNPTSSCLWRNVIAALAGSAPGFHWPRQIPIDGEPAQMVELVSAYDKSVARWPTRWRVLRASIDYPVHAEEQA